MTVLEELHLVGVTLRASSTPGPLSFPHLTRLSLVNTAGESSAWEAFIIPNSLPALTTLSVADFINPSRSDEGSPLSHPPRTRNLAPLLPQLTSFVFPVRYLEVHKLLPWSTCTNLERLTLRIDHVDIYSTIVKAIMPRRLELLRIVLYTLSSGLLVGHEASLDQLEAVVTSSDEGRLPFKRLSLPQQQIAPPCVCGACVNLLRGSNTILESLVRLAEKGGVAVERREVLPERVYELWETYLDECWFVQLHRLSCVSAG